MVPKYRAWNKKTQSFIDYGDLVLDLRSGKTYAGDIGLVESAIDVTDQIELMQSTGRKDKNGVEIFEGDVVKMDRPPVNEKSLFLVKDYVLGKVIFAEVNEFGEDSWSFNGGYTGYSLEVIGNIYENPELLEVEDIDKESL